jgi:hypothetical protein
MDWIDAGVGALGTYISIPHWPMGCCAACWSTACSPGIGSVLVFLPQILILFFFILVLEDSGYLPRAAYPARPPDGQRGPLGTRLHPAAVVVRLRDSRHHGNAHHPNVRDRSPPS